MTYGIQKLTIEGFKSIRNLDDFQLRSLNVLIGANGAGKSNFVGFFRMLRELIEQRLQLAVQIEGGADSCLYLGPKITRRIAAKLEFGRNGYEFELVPTANNRLVFAREVALFDGDYGKTGDFFGSGHAEAKLKDHKDDPDKPGRGYGIAHHVYQAVSRWTVYHFHDTSTSAGVRRQGAINDNEVFRPNADNLAAFLFRLSTGSPFAYSRIRDVVRLAAPFFDDFKLRPVHDNSGLIQLEWLQRDSDYPFQAHQLSDGTLRFICMATALLQPSPPATLLFDEPELGLHPYALNLLAGLFRKAATASQLIVSTQSVPLLNEFAPEDVIVVDRERGESVFRRLDSVQLSGWLEDYSLGDLWEKNVLGGRPRSEEAPVIRQG